MADILYTVEKACVMCDKRFSVTKVRNRLSMLKQDSDFCTYYKEVNPYYYSVWVCPHCGYAAQDTYFEEQPAKMAAVKTFLSGRDVKVNFSGERTRQEAVTTYKLAIFFADMAGTLPSRQAGLYLKLAWLYREGGLPDEEKTMLDQAREHYELAFLKERLPIGNMSQLTLEYLIGELLRRTGRLPEALNYLGKVVGNPQAKNEKRVLELAREAWTLAREARKEQAAEKSGADDEQPGT
ncbi:DUF2225 domain-containing protein [Anaeroselena agilis]|uniref:DUF2225 domain-containing protein n=1 Tax=Anaeroselena agilis TaxID=3063788 RepID=A0ABU3P605_9FIRM|nr:DUF2225 domain-containing protein [Selenomonadales bacterium 4137-cl]